jgi:hypothetical protein
MSAMAALPGNSAEPRGPADAPSTVVTQPVFVLSPAVVVAVSCGRFVAHAESGVACHRVAGILSGRSWGVAGRR